MTRIGHRRRPGAALVLLVCLAVCLAVAAPALAADGPAPAEQSPRSGVPVQVDPRVELLSIIFFLAGNPEYGRGRVASYSEDVQEHFGPFRDHAAVQLARKLRSTRGVSYDACMSMAVHLRDTSALETELPLEPPPEWLDGRWGTPGARQFLDAARRFVEDTSFNAFFADHRPLFHLTESRLDAMLRKSANLEWFDEFFGPRPRASFTVVPGMLNGGSCYGSRCRVGDVEKLYCILGVWQTDGQGDPAFHASMVDTVVHEFCHSYTNPIVDRHMAELEAAGTKIFPRVESKLRRQAYGRWQTMMYESLVRACVIRYVRKQRGPLMARLAIEGEKQKGFLWIAGLCDLLGRYEADRQQYPTVDDFFPQIVDFFDQYAEAMPERDEGFLAGAARRLADLAEQQVAAARPQVVSVTPADGATDVDPGLDALRVVFDRAMADGGWSLVGGGPHFPEVTGVPSYDAAKTVWTVPVKLKPGWSYQFMLNSDRFQNFRSRHGVALAPVRVRFTTRP